MALEKELDYFNAHREEWVGDGLTGKWAVIVNGDDLVGHFDELSKAYEAGVNRVGNNVPFLVKQIKPTDTVETIHRVHWGPREAARQA